MLKLRLIEKLENSKSLNLPLKPRPDARLRRRDKLLPEPSGRLRSRLLDLRPRRELKRFKLNVRLELENTKLSKRDSELMPSPRQKLLRLKDKPEPKLKNKDLILQGNMNHWVKDLEKPEEQPMLNAN